MSPRVLFGFWLSPHFLQCWSPEISTSVYMSRFFFSRTIVDNLMITQKWNFTIKTENMDILLHWVLVGKIKFWFPPSSKISILSVPTGLDIVFMFYFLSLFNVIIIDQHPLLTRIIKSLEFPLFYEYSCINSLWL